MLVQVAVEVIGGLGHPWLVALVRGSVVPFGKVMIHRAHKLPNVTHAYILYFIDMPYVHTSCFLQTTTKLCLELLSVFGESLHLGRQFACRCLPCGYPM